MPKRRLTREESRQATREAILDAAERQFVEHGYRQASLDGIAEAAGFSKGAVYSNFASKADLFLVLMDRHAVSEEASLASDTRGVPKQEFGWPLATLDFFVDAVGDPDVRAALAERYEAARRSVGSRIAVGRPSPSWASWEEVASIAMALGSGLIIQSAIDPDSVDGDLMERTMARLLE
jgi:AcrR family transcriptional regulator